MANIIINDILDELRDENNRLFNENKVICDLLFKYRRVLLNVQNICVCNQKSNNDFMIKSLEVEYQRIANQKSIISVKKGRFDTKSPPISSSNKSKAKIVKKKSHKIQSIESNDESSGVSVQKRAYRQTKPKNSLKKPVFCEYVGCGQQFKCNSLMEVHTRRKHTFIRPFKCDDCEKGFFTKLELNSHQLIHSDVKQFECQQCDKCFSNRQGLYKHKEVFHALQPVVYKCDICPFETRYRGQLKPHMKRVHTISEASVKCDVEDCDKLFKTIELMKRHKKYFHSEKRHTCDWPGCGQAFKGKWIYEDHKRSHLGIREFKCPYEGCGKSFIMGKTLHQHKQSHQKKFVCSWPECGQRFSSKPELVAHINKHQNIKPFKCDFFGCNKDFYSKPHLNLHIRTSHKSD